MTLEVRVRIDTRAAVLARRAASGTQTVTVTDDDLKDLTDPELEVLANIVASGEVINSPLASDATFDVVLAVVRDVLNAAEAQKVAAAQQDVERRKQEARDLEDKANKKRQNAARDAENQKAIDAWVEANLVEEQKERHRARFLPPEEIIEEVEHALFEINEDEHVPLRQEEACDCDKGCTRSVRFAVAAIVPNITPLDSRQFATLERIKEGAPKGASIDPRIHRAFCGECKCAPLARLTAKVSLEWNGWLLVKEYSLG